MEVFMVYNESDKTKWTKDGRHWYFRIAYRDAKGKKRYMKSKRFKTRELAEAEELKFKTKRDNPTAVKFQVVADEYLKSIYKTKRESTAITYDNAYKLHIEPFFKDFYINGIDIYNIDVWHEELEKKGYNTVYLNKIHRILVSIFDYGIKHYNLSTNYAKISGTFQKPKDEVVEDSDKIRYITLDEFNKFISVVDIPFWKIFFTFLFYTGMRKGEVQALTWNDIDFSNDEIIVNKSLSTKTQSTYKITATKNCINRKVKINKALKEALSEHKEECMKYTDFKESWFVFGNSRFLPSSTIDRYKHKYFKLSGVSEITIHEFRHSHVSLLVNEYIKSGQTDTAKFFIMMSNRMGHSINVMQRTYLHLFDSVQNEVVELLNNL